MGFFNFFNRPDINQGVAECQSTPGAVLLDVRTTQEYAEGHIPSSRNVPLHTIRQIADTVADKDTPLFVYCLSGGRSSQAADFLRQMGYSRVTNIGGISAYKGPMER